MLFFKFILNLFRVFFFCIINNNVYVSNYVYVCLILSRSNKILPCLKKTIFCLKGDNAFYGLDGVVYSIHVYFVCKFSIDKLGFVFVLYNYSYYFYYYNYYYYHFPFHCYYYCVLNIIISIIRKSTH